MIFFLKPQGKPPDEWTAKYWQWIVSHTMDLNPLKTGVINTDDEFICLPCTGGGESCDRSIELSGIQAKKPILVPVFTSIASTAATPNDSDEALRKRARTASIIPKEKIMSLDGKKLKPHYVETVESFILDAPERNWLDTNNAPAGKYRAVACGYWHKLAPLSNGRHTVLFGGTGYDGFHTKVQYEVIVT